MLYKKILSSEGILEGSNLKNFETNEQNWSQPETPCKMSKYFDAPLQFITVEADKKRRKLL